MTSPSSSISSSEARRYLGLLLGTAGVLLAVVFALTYAGFRYALLDYTFMDLYRYQRAKLATSSPVDVLFVGDSSLGNAIDARRWEEVSGQKALNVALTGVYGYAGALNMTRAALETVKPKTVVIMQTADIMARPTPLLGFIQTYSGPSLLNEISPQEAVQSLINLDTALSTVQALRREWSRRRPKDLGRIHNDYVRQARPLPSIHLSAFREQTVFLTPDQINRDNLRFLRTLSNVCKENGLQCVYVHGPLIETLCRKSPEYLATVNALIDSLTLARANDSPMCILETEVGDSVDHIRPDLKPVYTERFYELLKPWLRGQRIKPTPGQVVARETSATH